MLDPRHGPAPQPGRLFEGCKSWDLPQATARAYPHASADDENWFSPAFLFDGQFDAHLPDRADRVAEVAGEPIATSLRSAGSRPRVLCPVEARRTVVFPWRSHGRTDAADGPDIPGQAPVDRASGATGIGSSGAPGSHLAAVAHLGSGSRMIRTHYA